MKAIRPCTNLSLTIPVAAYCTKAGYPLDTVLPAGEIFYLQEKIPAAFGSDYVDCTGELHLNIIQQCIKFARQFPCLTR